MKTKFNLLLYMLLLSALSYAQLPAGQENDVPKLEAKAKAYLDAEKYLLAEPLYHTLDSIKPANPAYIYPLAVCLVNNSKNVKALEYIQVCLKKAASYPSAVYYYAGKAYHLSHKLDEAIKYYERYKGIINKSDSRNKAGLLANINREIQMCRNGKLLMANPVSIEVFNMGPVVNSPFPDYGPVVSIEEDQLLFTSNRPNTTGGQRTEDGVYYEDIYISKRTSKGWTAPVKMNEGINTIGHDATKCISSDGEKMIIYRYGKDKMMGQASGGLYISELKNEQWTTAQRLSDKINSPGWEPSASIGDGERIIYFASNRPGGYGGTDIYSIKKLPNGEWAEPWNLGPSINTANDEDSPYIHADGKTLYFSSNGHTSMGGYDIFMSKMNEEKRTWSVPENVGYPINTAHDDLYFSWSADGTRIYFSGVRPEGHGDKDIYYAVINKKQSEILVLKGKVQDAASSKTIPATIKVIDKKTNQVQGIYKSNSDNGSYLAILPGGKDSMLTVEADGFRSVSQNFDVKDLRDYKEEEFNFLLHPDK